MLGNSDTTVTSGSVTNSNGGTIYGATSGIYVNGYGTVTNIGVSTISSQGIGVDIRLAGTVSNLSGGVISGTTADAVSIYGAGRPTTNKGSGVSMPDCYRDRRALRNSWEATSQTLQAAPSLEQATSASSSMARGSISNSGLISGARMGIYLYEGGSIYNAPGGIDLWR